MKIVMIGDIVASAGCRAIASYVPLLRRELRPDFVIANAENAAFHGMDRAIVDELFAAGVDGLTSGNHMWDNKGIYDIIDSEPRLIRPMNYVAHKPGRGHMVVTNAKGQKLLVLNVLGRLFMGDQVENPFDAVDAVISRHKMGTDVQGILVDFHTETTAEKNAMGFFCDGRVSLVVGTHTHMPTADHHVLPGGTAYQTDLGMTGDYDSNIGVKKDLMFQAFYSGKKDDSVLSAADGDPTLCGCLADIDEATGLARSIAPIRIGGHLAATHSFKQKAA